MSGDYSRMRYSAPQGYIYVREQQGRVRLDSDVNEEAESIDRRRRAETIDTVGRGVIPDTTKAAFAISPDGSGGYTIGPGRAYVDGILVDCWGDDPPQFDIYLGEWRGPSPIKFSEQPFYYGAAFPVPSAADPSLVYLDVWEREVTALEDPGLIDPALAGIDTTTRVQAAWQVKGLTLSAPATCNDTPPEWAKLTAPSTGVLSTSTVPTPSTASPCVIDPVSGYTGLENRLYRVQIQTGGSVDGAGAATFVWSDENSSLGAAITGGITSLGSNTCQLSVSTVGKDKTFSFQVGDWVEVLDNVVEWSMRETNAGGTFVQVTSVNPDGLTINVSPDVSSTFTVVAANNPRIRRWNSKPQPTNAGAPIPLENGIQVTFGNVAIDTLRAGDYWQFYARTATGTIEMLTDCGPRGVLHHYLRLATIDPSSPQPIDCRSFWPPAFGGGCCTVVIYPGDNIQAGVDSLPKQIGGCVCLKAGVHTITTPINIQGLQNIHVHGESIGAVVQNTAGGAAVAITNSSFITIEDISFQVAPSADESEAVIEISAAQNCTVRHCDLGLMTPDASVSLNTFGVIIDEGTSRVALDGLTMTNLSYGVYSQDIKRISISITDSVFSGPTTVDANQNPLSAGLICIQLAGESEDCTVRRNTIKNFANGIQVSGAGSPCAIDDNVIQCSAMPTGAESSFGFTGKLGTLLQYKGYGIICESALASICGNFLTLQDPACGGILVTGATSRIVGNVIQSTVQWKDAKWSSLPIGIVAYSAGAPASQYCRIAGNRLTGNQKGIAVLAEIAGTINGVQIEGNVVVGAAGSGNTLASVVADAAGDVNTTLIDALAPLDLLFADDLYGLVAILTINAPNVMIGRNTIESCDFGIVAVASTRKPAATSSVSLSENSIDTSVFGIWLFGMEYSTVSGGTLQNTQIGIIVDYGGGVDVRYNQIAGGEEAQILVLNSSGVRIVGNLIAGGATGILAAIVRDVQIADNEVSGTNGTGVVAYECELSVGIQRNSVVACGVTGVSILEATLLGKQGDMNFGTSASCGIAAIRCTGLIEIDGCTVRQTAQLTDAKCIDIYVFEGDHVRVRGCRVARTAVLVSNPPVTPAVSVVIPPKQVDSLANGGQTHVTIDVSGNSLDIALSSEKQSAMQIKGFQENNKGNGGPTSDLLFNGNTVITRGITRGPEAAVPAVSILAGCIAATGNRIRCDGVGRLEGLLIVYYTGLSYVGNIVSRGAKIEGPAGQYLPTPDTSFNVNA